MASFRAEVKPISRTATPTKQGKNAVAAAAYRAGEKLTDTNKYNLDATTHDYSKKSDVMHKNIILPKSLSDQDFSIDRQTLWSSVEQHEVTQRGNKMKATARVAREWLLSLPHELSDAENIALAEEFAQKMADDMGVIADCCIHNPKLSTKTKEDDRNIHAHIMFTTRKTSMTADGELVLGNKADCELDGTARKAKGLIKEADYIKQVRSTWADMVNERLAKHDIALVSSLSYKDRNLDILPQTHHGRDYQEDDKKEHNDDIITRNELVFKSRAAIVEGFASAANASADSSNKRLEYSQQRIEYSQRHAQDSKQRLGHCEQSTAQTDSYIARASDWSDKSSAWLTRATPTPFDRKSRAAELDDQAIIFDRLAERANQITAKPVVAPIIDNRLEIPTERGSYLGNDKSFMLYKDMHTLHDDFVTRISGGYDAREQYKAFADKCSSVSLHADYMVKKNQFADELISSTYELLDKVDQLLDNASRYADDANYDKAPRTNASRTVDIVREYVLYRYGVNGMPRPDKAPAPTPAPQAERDYQPPSP